MHLDTNTNTILTQSNLHTCILSRHMYFVYARVFGLFVPWYTGIFWSRAERSSLKIIFFIFHFGSESAPLYSTSHWITRIQGIQRMRTITVPREYAPSGMRYWKVPLKTVYQMRSSLVRLPVTALQSWHNTVILRDCITVQYLVDLCWWYSPTSIQTRIWFRSLSRSGGSSSVMFWKFRFLTKFKRF